MKEQFTQEELKNIGALIANSPIKGSESIVVAMLLQKISTLLTPVTEDKKEETM